MSKILGSLLNSITHDVPVKSIFTSAHWILIESCSIGMASTIPSSKPHGEDLVSDAGNLLSKSARELAERCFSKNTLEAGIGIAAINSLIPDEFPQSNELNVVDYLRSSAKGKNLVFIGHFPFVEKLETIVDNLWVIDLKPAKNEFSPEQAPKILQDADIVAMTANTLIDHSVDYYLSHCKKEAKKIMMGPTTPLSPVLFDHGFDVLAGVKIKNAEMIFKYISQGAVFSQLKGIKKITIEK